MTTPICPYCNQPAQLVGGERIYPHREDLFEKRFWLCKRDAAYVGCHPKSKRPLGRLADAELRRAKIAAHAAFDPVWKTGKVSRSQAYALLAHLLGLAPKNCHIGMFDVATCEEVVAVCDSYFKKETAR